MNVMYLPLDDSSDSQVLEFFNKQITDKLDYEIFENMTKILYNQIYGKHFY